REAALNAMNDVYIANVGPIGRLNRRQFETGRPYLSPFLQTYSRELDGNANTLEKAVSQYLLEH
ncbi:MAG: hypothetical protein KC422_06700, partial [Trueperaceae bacterium]|nr:hypothetical protein [Trueperaceae bacterium]